MEAYSTAKDAVVSLEWHPDLQLYQLRILDSEQHRDIAHNLVDERLAGLIRRSRRVDTLKGAKGLGKQRRDWLDDERMRDQLGKLRERGPTAGRQ